MDHWRCLLRNIKETGFERERASWKGIGFFRLSRELPRFRSLSTSFIRKIYQYVDGGKCSKKNAGVAGREIVVPLLYPVTLIFLRNL